MKHIRTFESFLNEGMTVNTMIDNIKSGMGWATIDYVRQCPLNRPGKMALAQELAKMGILFDDDAISDAHHMGDLSPLDDKNIKPMSVEDAKKAL